MQLAEGVKPRYDNKGSEFGKMHRSLPKNFGMFDIDKINLTYSLQLKNQDSAFIEYQTDFRNNDCEFKALFELKFRMSDVVKQQIDCQTGTPTWAQLKMAEKLGCRYFIVVQDNGKPPFSFYEKFYDNTTKYWGVLEYNQENVTEKVNEFWIKIGLK